MTARVTRSLIAIAAMACLGCLGAQAQSLPAPMVEAARKAVRNNPEVQARWNAFLAAGNERDVARGGFLPQVDLTAQTGRENNRTQTQDYGGYNTTSSRLTINQMLFDGGFTASETKRLGYAKLTRYYELSEAAESTALEAVRAYVDVARYRELVEAATDNYAEHKAATLLVEERAKSGVGRGADVEQANGRLALAESNLLTEVTNLHDVSARYLRVVGEKPATNLGALPDPFKLGGLPASTDTLMREGLQKSPTINAAVENVRASNQAIETRNHAYQPRLDLRAFQSMGKNDGGIRGDTRTNGIELVLNINLYRGGSDSAAKRQTVNLKEQARDLQEKACRDVRQTLSIAYSDARSQLEQLRYQDQHRLSTEKSREAYRQQFEIGQRTLLDLLDTQNEFFEANRAYINTRHTQAAAQARVLSGMGQLVSVLGVARSDVPSLEEAGQDRSGINPTELCPYEEPTVATMEQIMADVVLPARARPPAPAAPAAAPAAPAPAPKAPTQLRLSADVLFDFGKSELKPEGLKRLDDLMGTLKDAALDVLIATGHTDSIGSEELNNRLSLERANSVKNYLVGKGLDVTRVRAIGKGKSQPVADNATDEGRSKNRRVDIDVVPAGAAPK